MQLNLSPELRQFIESKVQSGEYSTPQAAVEDALARWKAEETPSVSVLRELVVVGEQGDDVLSIAPTPPPLRLRP